MSSEHNSSSCDNSDCKFCGTLGSSLEDSSSEMEDNEQDLNNSKNESHQLPVNKPDLCQNLESTCNQSPSTIQSSFHTNQQTGEIANTSQSSQTLNYQPSQNKRSKSQDKKSFFLEVLSRSNLQPSDLPGTEFSSSQNIHPHGKEQPNQTSDMSPSVNESSETASKRFRTKKQLAISRDSVNQETVQTNLKKLSVNQSLCPLSQQFAGSNMNRIQRVGEENQQQSRNAQTVSKSLNSVSHQPHQNALNYASCAVARDSFENESGDNRVQNTGRDLQYHLRKSEANRLHLVSSQKIEGDAHFLKLQQSEGRVSCTQSSSPRKLLANECRKIPHQSSNSQPLKQSEDQSSCIQISPSQPLKQPECDTKVMDLSYKIDSVVNKRYSSTKSVFKKESIANSNLCTQQHTESRVLEVQEFPQFSQVFKVSNSTERSSPNSLSQQQKPNQRSSQEIQNSIQVKSSVQSSKPQQFQQTGSDLTAKEISRAVHPAEKSPSPCQGKFSQPSPYPLSEPQSMQKSSQRQQHSKYRPSCIQIPLLQLLEQSKTKENAKKRPQVVQHAKKSLGPSQNSFLQPSPYTLSQQQHQSMQTPSTELQQSTAITSCIQSSKPQQLEQIESNSKGQQMSQVDKSTGKTPSLGQNTFLQKDNWDDSKLTLSEQDVPSWVQILQQDYDSREKLLNRFIPMCVDQNIPSCQTQAQQYFDLRALQYPYANNSEPVNLLVYGPTRWTTLLINTFSRGKRFRFASPCVHALTKNIIRCGIVNTVSIFQVGDLIKSKNVIKICCFSAKVAIMLVLDVADQSVEVFFELIRHRVSRDLPIIFVVCKHKSSRDKGSTLFKVGFKLKAKYDLSAFLVCIVDSEEEVDAVFYNAMDVSRHITI